MSTIVIDTQGSGDEGREALEAAAIASLELDHEFVVVGHEEEITAALDGIAHDAERMRVVHAESRVERGADMRATISALPRSSIAAGLDCVARTPDAAFVSGGPPGAIVYRAVRALQRIPSISRAARRRRICVT